MVTVLDCGAPGPCLPLSEVSCFVSLSPHCIPQTRFSPTNDISSFVVCVYQEEARQQLSCVKCNQITVRPLVTVLKTHFSRQSPGQHCIPNSDIVQRCTSNTDFLCFSSNYAGEKQQRLTSSSFLFQQKGANQPAWSRHARFLANGPRCLLSCSVTVHGSNDTC